MNKTEQRKTVNVALIGVGFMGSEHSKAYSLAPVIFPDIAATPVKKVLCDINAELAKEKATLWGYEEWCTDWREVIARDDIDIIDLCTPPFLHAEMAIEAMKANKFVVSEKPLTTTVEDCERLVAAQKEYNGRTAVGFNKRRWPAVTLARKLIKEGVIGEPLVYNGRYCQPGSASTPLYSFRTDWKKGGGFADSASHVVDMARFILDDAFDEVVATTKIFDKEAIEYPKDGGAPIMHPRDCEDMVLMLAKMKSGVVTSIYKVSPYRGTGEDLSFEVIGRKGSMRWSGSNPSVFQLFENSSDVVKNGFKSVLMGPAHPYGQAVPSLPGFGVGVSDCMSFQAYEIVNACVNHTSYSPDFEEALEVVKVCDAARESERTKQWVKIR